MTYTSIVKENKQMKKIAREKLIETYRRKGCNVSATCSALNINRSTFYDWKKTDPKLAQELADAEEALLDFAESKLMEHINSGDVATLIFFLKTKAKARGYVERTQSEVQVNGFQQMMQELPD